MQIMNKEHQIIIFQGILAINSAKIPILPPKMAMWAQGILQYLGIGAPCSEINKHVSLNKLFFYCKYSQDQADNFLFGGKFELS